MSGDAIRALDGEAWIIGNDIVNFFLMLFTFYDVCGIIVSSKSHEHTDWVWRRLSSCTRKSRYNKFVPHMISTIIPHASSFIDAIDNLKDDNFQVATQLLNGVIYKDANDNTASMLLQSVNYWKDRVMRAQGLPNHKFAELIISEWKRFEAFLRDTDYEQETDERFIHRLRGIIVHKALDKLEKEERGYTGNDNGAFGWRARCYKILGNFESAIHNYQNALRIDAHSPTLIAELGDCYLLTGNNAAGKLLLRDAFYRSPQGVEIEYLDSALVADLIASLVQQLNTGDANLIKVWFPVYAEIWNILDVKREISNAEFGQMIQKQYTFEREHSECPSAINDAQLINLYFHLIDYYGRRGNANANEIKQYLFKIKMINSMIYDEYVHTDKE